ncbi:ribosome-associated protein [Ruminococcus sp. YRD2003]|uniref:ribosome silencing factor n=1 Tax=Ruminococcus sp. YRD2003 TaxID=1452313 RepID=UPI0008B79612|nr:ribosome silencing factor [Ruminococcus sp.]SEK88278.1 ribosome-associated protein [Ruminococcus flavefaciens]
MTEQEKLELIVKTLDSKRGEDIQALRIADLTILADYFVIVNGTSNTHARTLADEVEFVLSQKGIEPERREADTGNTWIILDYGDIIVHVFYKETRSFYQLEGLWADGEQVDISPLLVKENADENK